MEMPTVRNVVKDEQRKITYIFMAYRAMTREEILMGVSMLWQQRKKPKRWFQNLSVKKPGSDNQASEDQESQVDVISLLIAYP